MEKCKTWTTLQSNADSKLCNGLLNISYQRKADGMGQCCMYDSFKCTVNTFFIRPLQHQEQTRPMHKHKDLCCLI